MKELTLKDLKPSRLTPLLLKHVEQGHVKMYKYESVSDIREIIKEYNKMEGWIYKDVPNQIVGIRMTNKPLREDVLYPKEPKEFYTFTQDNGGCNATPFSKITVKISNAELVKELRRFFGWRKNVTAERFSKEGSRNYDRFIKHLAEAGYPSH